MPTLMWIEHLDSATWYPSLRKYHWQAAVSWGPLMVTGPMARTRTTAVAGALFRIWDWRFNGVLELS